MLARRMGGSSTTVAALSACRVQQHLQSLSGGGQYNVLLLHADQDWVQQCAQWERAKRGEHRPPSCPATYPTMRIRAHINACMPTAAACRAPAGQLCEQHSHCWRQLASA